MHGAIVFFALLGGLTVFGTVGLIAGPLVVSFFLALVRIYQRDFGKHPDLTDATGRPASAAGSGVAAERKSSVDGAKVVSEPGAKLVI